VYSPAGYPAATGRRPSSVRLAARRGAHLSPLVRLARNAPRRPRGPHGYAHANNTRNCCDDPDPEPKGLHTAQFERGRSVPWELSPIHASPGIVLGSAA
jgi:hypothetical protein